MMSAFVKNLLFSSLVSVFVPKEKEKKKKQILNRGLFLVGVLCFMFGVFFYLFILFFFSVLSARKVALSVFLKQVSFFDI